MEESKMYDSNMKYKWDNANVKAYERVIAIKEKEEAVKAAVKNVQEQVNIRWIEKMKNMAIELKKEKKYLLLKFQNTPNFRSKK